MKWSNIVVFFIVLFRISQRKTEWYTPLRKLKSEN